MKIRLVPNKISPMNSLRRRSWLYSQSCLIQKAALRFIRIFLQGRKIRVGFFISRLIEYCYLRGHKTRKQVHKTWTKTRASLPATVKKTVLCWRQWRKALELDNFSHWRQHWIYLRKGFIIPKIISDCKRLRIRNILGQQAFILAPNIIRLRPATRSPLAGTHIKFFFFFNLIR